MSVLLPLSAAYDLAYWSVSIHQLRQQSPTFEKLEVFFCDNGLYMSDSLSAAKEYTHTIHIVSLKHKGEEALLLRITEELTAHVRVKHTYAGSKSKRILHVGIAICVFMYADGETFICCNSRINTVQFRQWDRAKSTEELVIEQVWLHCLASSAYYRYAASPAST